MNEREAREILRLHSHQEKAVKADVEFNPFHEARYLFIEAKGYLEAEDKARALEECIDGLICGTCDAETAEEVLKKWRREK